MQGMEPHEALAFLLAFISTYVFFMTSPGRAFWGDLGFMPMLAGYAAIAILCLTSVVWLTIIGILRGLVHG